MTRSDRIDPSARRGLVHGNPPPRRSNSFFSFLGFNRQRRKPPVWWIDDERHSIVTGRSTVRPEFVEVDNPPRNVGSSVIPVRSRSQLLQELGGLVARLRGPVGQFDRSFERDET